MTFPPILGYVYVFLMKYLFPLIFAMAVIYLIYGAINYFIVGPGEEPSLSEGREQLTWGFLLCVWGMILFGVLAAIIWFGGFVFTLSSNVSGEIDAETQETIRVQKVPNVPSANN